MCKGPKVDAHRIGPGREFKWFCYALCLSNAREHQTGKHESVKKSLCFHVPFSVNHDLKVFKYCREDAAF